MDVGKAFSYITEDENWVSKLGVGVVLGMIPFVNLALFGYHFQIARNVWHGEKRPLPTWNDFGKFFVDGLRLFAAMIIYMLPVFIVYGIAMGAIIFSSISMESATYGSSGYGDGDFFPFSIIVMALLMLCIMPYSLLTMVMYPMFFIQIARRSSVKACFDFREMWTLFRAQPANYLIILAILFGLYMVLSMAMTPFYFIAILIPCIGFLVMMLISGVMIILVSVVAGHLEGQFILEGDDTLSLNGIEKEPI